MLQESKHEAVREQQALQRQQAEEEEESDEEEEEHGREAGDSRIFCSLEYVPIQRFIGTPVGRHVLCTHL